MIPWCPHWSFTSDYTWLLQLPTIWRTLLGWTDTPQLKLHIRFCSSFQFLSNAGLTRSFLLAPNTRLICCMASHGADLLLVYSSSCFGVSVPRLQVMGGTNSAHIPTDAPRAPREMQNNNLYCVPLDVIPNASNCRYSRNYTRACDRSAEEYCACCLFLAAF